MKFIQCPVCGKNIDDDSNFCMYCGEEIETVQNEEDVEPATVTEQEPVIENTPVVEPVVQNVSNVEEDTVKIKDAEIEKLSAELERMKKEKKENEKNEKKKNTKIASWISAILIAAVGLGVYFLFFNKEEEEPYHEEQLADADAQHVATETSSFEDTPSAPDMNTIEEEDEEEYLLEEDDSVYWNEPDLVICSGIIDDQYPITVELVFFANDSIEGSYYYDKNGPDRSLTLKGYYETENSYILYEYNNEGKHTGTFKTTEIEESGLSSGIFTVVSSGKEMLYRFYYKSNEEE